MWRWLTYAAIILVTLALVPPVLIARSRTVKAPKPRLHLIFDMDQQPRFEEQQTNALFADDRAMRPLVEGTVARGMLRENDHLYRGKTDDEWATTFPIEVTPAVMQRGRERFDIFCAACHGLDGFGRGPVAVRAEEREEPAWVPPLSFHADQVLERPVGHLFNTITNGIRTMPPYGPQIPVADRWAIVAYVRALQRSQRSSLEDVPPEIRDALR